MRGRQSLRTRLLAGAIGAAAAVALATPALAQEVTEDEGLLEDDGMLDEGGVLLEDEQEWGTEYEYGYGEEEGFGYGTETGDAGLFGEMTGAYDQQNADDDWFFDTYTFDQGLQFGGAGYDPYTDTYEWEETDLF